MSGTSELISAFAGAIAGAGAAAGLAWIIERRRRREDELLACNVAIGQCVSIANAFITVKRQTVGATVARYVAESASAFFVRISAPNGFTALPTNVAFDFRTTNSPWTAIEGLTWTIAQRIQSNSKASMLVPSLALAIVNQRNASDRRNALAGILSGLPPQEKLARYFGLPLPGGFDTNFPDVMQTLHHYTDDCIYHATLLADLLNAHGAELNAKLGPSAPLVNRADFSSAADAIPSPKNYPDFEAQFRPKRADMIVTM